MESYFFDRDISWLSFNERVLQEAAKSSLPAGERINYLSIFSSNLDEFYRVRIPALMALHRITAEKEHDQTLEQIKDIVDRQQKQFGVILRQVKDTLAQQHEVILLYGQCIPDSIREEVKRYFFTQVMTFLRPVYLSDHPDFFPQTNHIYFAVSLERNDKREIVVLNIPSTFLGRFFLAPADNLRYVVFLDDIIRENLDYIFPDQVIFRCHSFKITRDAELNLKDEYEGDLAEKIEQQLLKRDMGFATRFLYDSSMSELDLQIFIRNLQLERADHIAGARYHNLKDLATLPLKNIRDLYYEKWPPIISLAAGTIFSRMEQVDFMTHVPYQSYDTVLRFFNEAALDEHVTEVFVTLYRVASDSRIAHALISAAKNGKKVMVFVELKARFDEANNIRWAKKMQAAGVRITYSIPGLKVHSKVALVKCRKGNRIAYYGLLSTGNFNESTARIYTDHILFTTHRDILRELELLFIFLGKRKRIKENRYHIEFQHLLVSKFNLHTHFLQLIDDEINEARRQRPASMLIKLNNLEEETLINKLYEASRAGVKIQLIVRSVCRLVAGIPEMSENITVRRIVGRYLEHGRIFVFHHGGDEKIFAGSADWMNRNIHRRIEVCYPIYDENLKQKLKEILQLELADNTQAVLIDKNLQNIPIKNIDPPVESQKEIYQLLKKQNNK